MTSSGTISVRNVFYNVPSRLVGCRLKVQIYDDRLIDYLGTTPVLSVARHYYKPNGPRQRVVDYHHLVGALVKKPQAFRRSVFRDELFPRPVFRCAWGVLDERVEARKACRVYVGLLHLAAMHGCEATLADHLAAELDAGGTRSRSGAGGDRAAGPDCHSGRDGAGARSGRLRCAARVPVLREDE